MEFYFSDVNLATTDHLMKFITKDPDGFGKFNLLNLNKAPDPAVYFHACSFIRYLIAEINLIYYLCNMQCDDKIPANADIDILRPAIIFIL